MNSLQRILIQYTYERKNLSKMICNIDSNLKQVKKMLNTKKGAESK